ncbi:hypothetical protein ES332_A06G160100v1 [Gossypium tomentosum]|uniref:Uncharacterized protein n=1 Tax=Gossypium tomentosum TaxID=34277 RepID=A0A5D2Q796_GOSTO|nr:hypothetical protein ES332_A06G160100v1 [Gossypium tomentosum]
MEYPITGVFHSGLKQRFLGISIPFPFHRLAIRWLKNPILPLQKFHLKTLSIGSHFSYPTPAFLPYQVGAGSFFHIGNARHYYGILAYYSKVKDVIYFRPVETCTFVER